MKTQYITLILLIGAFIITIALTVNGQVTLDQCIELSKTNNPSLQRTALERQLDLPASMAAWGQFLPSISAGYGIEQTNLTTKTYIKPDGTVGLLTIPIEFERRASGYYVRLSETIFDGGNNYLNLKNSSFSKQIRDHRLKYEEFALRTRVTSAFVAAVAAERTLDLTSKVVEQRRLQLMLAETRFETGSVTRRDVLQAEVDLGRALSDSLSAILAVNRSFESLNILIGLPLDTTYALAELPPPFRPEWDADSLVQSAVEKRDDLKSAELTTNLRRNDHYAARGNFLPFLTASYLHSRSEQSGVNTSFTTAPRNRYNEVDLNLSWTIFDRFTRSLRLQEAKIRRRQAELSVYELSLEIHRQVRAAADKLTALYNQVEVAAQNSSWAEETLKFEQERYRIGSATVIELGAAQLSFIQAKNDQIALETEFYVALGELELATGTKLR